MIMDRDWDFNDDDDDGYLLSDWSNPKSSTPYRATYPWWLGAHVEENEPIGFVCSEFEGYRSGLHCFPFW